MIKYLLPLCTFIAMHAAAQNVGVGTPTPGAQLHVKSTAAEVLRVEGSNPYLSLYDNSQGYRGYLWYTGSRLELGTPLGSGLPVVIAPGISQAAVFTSTGLGLGVTPSVGKLDVFHNSAVPGPHIALIENGSDYARLTFKNNSVASFWSLAGLNSASSSSEKFNIYHSITGDILTLTGDGRVGIGEPNPGADVKLHVAATQLSGSYFTNTSNGSTSSVMTVENIGGGIPNHFNTGISINQGAVEGRGRGLNVSAGYIGAELNSIDITGASQNYGLISRTNSSNDAWAVYAICQGALGGTKIGVYSNPTGGLTNWAFYGVGNSFLSGGTWQTSDERLKTNINTLSNASQLLKKLSARSYHFIKNDMSQLNLPTEKQFGFLASELEQVFPNLVKEVDHTIGQPKPGEAADKVRFKSVNYTGLVPVLAQAINEHSTTIEELKKQNEELKTLVQALLVEVKGLKEGQ